MSDKKNLKQKIAIDPITRLEGHGRIDLFLDEQGGLANAYMIIPELRGFEKFCEGRPVEEMPRITQRICGVCPMAHHMAAAKAGDAVYHVQIPPAAKKIRELVYSAFFVADHATHFYVLGGPDFVVGPEAPKAERNILGVVKAVGKEIGAQVMQLLKENHEVSTIIGGRYIHPVGALVGGVSKPLTAAERDRLIQIGQNSVKTAQFSLKLFEDVVLKNKAYKEMILSEAYRHETYYMGMVDEHNKVNFYDGLMRIVRPDGSELRKFSGNEYLDVIAEHIEPWTYLKFPYLKQIGWKGFVDGPASGVYRASPLARLNVSEGFTTPLAQKEYERYFDVLGGKPVHATLATHWARLIELLYAAEHELELALDEEILSQDVRTIPTATPDEGIGISRGAARHAHPSLPDGCQRPAEKGQPDRRHHQQLRRHRHVDQEGRPGAGAARPTGHGGHPQQDRDGLPQLTTRASAAPRMPCPGEMPLIVNIYDADGCLRQEIRRDQE